MKIETAYCYSRKFNVYRAAAHVREANGTVHSRTVALGDTKSEAVDDAVRHVQKMFEREGLTVPEQVEHFGKVSTAWVDNHWFGNRS